MSSMRNAVQRRNYKERAQPVEREKWGVLEKHKVRKDVTSLSNFNVLRDSLGLFIKSEGLQRKEEAAQDSTAKSCGSESR